MPHRFILLALVLLAFLLNGCAAQPSSAELAALDSIIIAQQGPDAHYSGAGSLAQTLLKGNTTGGTDITVSNGDTITSAASTDLDIRAASGQMVWLNGTWEFLSSGVLRPTNDALFNIGDSTHQVGSLYTTRVDVAGSIIESAGGSDTVVMCSAGTLYLGSDGTNRWGVDVSNGHLLPVSGNTYDVGSSSAKVRTVYAGTSVNVGASSIYAGSGTPEGAVTAVVGSLYLRSDGGAGTSLYVKESGSGNTGWAAK